LLASCATAPRAPDEGGRPWVRVETTNLVLETDLDAKAAQELAGDLERWRLAMTVAVFPGIAGPPSHLSVIALRPGELQALHAPFIGLFLDPVFVGPTLILGERHGDDPLPVLKHELAHAVVRQNLPQAPQWLSEGVATFLETTELDPSTGDLTWGARQEGHTFQGLIVENLEALLAAPTWPQSRRAEATFIAGRLVRMLARNHPAALACFLHGLRAFEAPGAALDRCFPVRVSWPSEINDDGWGNAPAVGRARVLLPQVQTLSLRMPDGDVHALLALVDWAVSGQVAGARDHAERRAAFESHLQRALALDPGQPLANALDQPVRERSARERLDHAASAVREHPEDWRTWAMRAWALETPDNPRSARCESAGQAQRLEPDRGEVLLALAHCALRDHRWQEAEELARHASYVLPESVEPRAARLVALEQLGDCPTARTVVDNTPALSDALPAAARKLCDLLGLGAPRCLPPE
jgi:hypothetical protein